MLVAFVPKAHAQTVNGMTDINTTGSLSLETSNFSNSMYSETSFISLWLSIDSAGNKVLNVDSTVDGSVGAAGVEVHAYHTYNITSTLGGVTRYAESSSYNTGGADLAQSQIATPGEDVTWDGELSITCSFAGPVWNYEPSNTIHFEIAYQHTATTGARSGCYPAGNGTTRCLIAQQSWCTPTTTPSDLQVGAVNDVTYPTSPASFYNNFAACARWTAPGGKWYCSPAVSFPSSYSGLDICTKTP